MPIPKNEIERLNRCFTVTTKLREDIQRVQHAEKGSLLRRDDNDCHPMSMSSYCHTLLLVAIDHLDALKEVMSSTQKMPVYSSHTLIRTALECSSTVIHLLSIENRKERIAARLSLFRSSYENLNQALAELADFVGDDDVELTQYKKDSDEYYKVNERRIEKIISDQKLPPLKAVTGTRDTVFKAAEIVFGKDSMTYPAFVWRSASGIAHGKEWATLRLMTRERVDTKSPSSGVVTYSLGADSAFVTSSLECAVKTLEKAYEIYVRALKK